MHIHYMCMCVCVCTSRCVRAAGSMARRSPANKVRLAQLGLCEQIVPLFRSYGGVALTQAAAAGSMMGLMEALCWCIGQLGHPDRANQDRLGRAGAGEVVCAALHRAAREDAGQGEVAVPGFESQCLSLLEEALRALHSLARSHPRNAQLLFQWAPSDDDGDGGGGGDGQLCVTLTCLLRRHRARSAVLQWIWFAVGSLCADLTFLARFGQLHICELAVDALVRSGLPSP